MTEAGTTTVTNGESSATQTRLHMGRDDGIVMIAAYHFLVAGLFLLGTVIMSLPTMILGVVTITEAREAAIGMVATGMIGGIMMIFCLLYLSIGYGLWKLKAWGRVAAIAVGVISLFAFPIGTIAGALTLWYLLKEEVAAKFQ